MPKKNRAARTAWGPAVQVALEQWIPPNQRIVHDAIAFSLLPDYLKLLVSLFRIAPLRHALWNIIERRVPGIRGGILCRKRHIDDKLDDALQHGIESLVILGAGMDTRAYRLPTASAAQVYEIDLPENIECKEEYVRRLMGTVPAHVKLVPIDFNCQELGQVLPDAGYSSKHKSFFVWEGVTQYISETAVRKVFAFLQQASQESRLAFTYVRKDFIEGKQFCGLDALYSATRAKNQLWQFGLEPEAVGAFLGEYGWSEIEQVGSAEYQERYLKPVGRVMPVMQVERIVYAERSGPTS